MKLNIKYGINYELKRVVWTLNQLDWYYNNGYKPKLPQNITKDCTEREISEAIKAEYDDKDYKIASKKLRAEFSKIQKDFFSKLKEKFKTETIIPNLEIILTKYGTGWSYHSPKTAVVNIDRKNILEVALHEIVHLFAKPTVQKQKMSHWEKEKFVESIMAEICTTNNKKIRC